MLQPLRSAIYAFKADSWWRPGSPAEADRARGRRRRSSGRAGFPNPAIRDFDDQPLDLKALDSDQRA